MAVGAPPHAGGAPRAHRGAGFYLVIAALILASLFYLMPLYVMFVNGMKDKSYMTLT
ncbi:MAG: hypothetical protein IT335_00530, partial [Thermomicrobiales bacterium]|nr:hypothetical protein [Thermomicrobiales bacterium]